MNRLHQPSVITAPLERENLSCQEFSIRSYTNYHFVPSQYIRSSLPYKFDNFTIKMYIQDVGTFKLPGFDAGNSNGYVSSQMH